jgi:hypothetical protein
MVVGVRLAAFPRTLAMKVWVGLKRDGEYVYQSEQEIPPDCEPETAVSQALVAYRQKTGHTLWGLTILVDKVR